MEKKLYSIGEICTITNLSRKTLRHYDNIDLLKPDFVNPKNNYRFYSEYQILKLQIILALKDNGFSLEEIKKEFLCKNNKSLHSFIEKYKYKIEKIDENIEELKKNKKNIENILNIFQFQDLEKITLKKFDERFFYSLEGVGDSKLNISFMDIFKIIQSSITSGNGYLGKKIRDNSNKSFLLFKKDIYLDKKEKISEGEFITIRYRNANRDQALNKITEYIKNNNIEIEDVIYEIEIVNSFLTNKEIEYITEIQIPIKKGKLMHYNLKNGKFIGCGKGYGGEIKSEITIENGKIVNIQFISHNETKIISDPAFENIPSLIIKTNSILVPNVSGCSMSSRGIRESVKNALIEAGENPELLELQLLEAENLEKIKHGNNKKIIRPIENFDVVIIGAGGAGLSAAIAAANRGLKTVVLEKMSSVGGNTLISMGGINIPENSVQISKDIKDSKNIFREDILKGGDFKNSPMLLDIFVNNALDTFNWLKEFVKVEFKDELIHFGGHSVPRAAVFKGKYGIELISKLRAKALLLGVEIKTDVFCESLIEDFDKVVGVVGKIENTPVKFYGKEGVILATGGFSGNIELRKKYNPNLDERYKTTNISSITGDGHIMSEKIGADFTQMEYIQTFPISNPETGELSHVGGTRFDGAILVNKNGDRFVEELERRDVVSEAILNQENGVAYLVWSKEIESLVNRTEKNKEEVERLKNSKLFHKGDSLIECGEYFGLNLENLSKTIDKYNAFVENKKDLDFNRRGDLVEIKDGPFYIQQVAPAVHHTMGGLKIDENCRVLNKNNEPITGLYAAGEIVGGLHGTNRLGGNAITEVIVFGKKAGENIGK